MLEGVTDLVYFEPDPSLLPELGKAFGYPQP